MTRSNLEAACILGAAYLRRVALFSGCVSLAVGPRKLDTDSIRYKRVSRIVQVRARNKTENDKKDSLATSRRKRWQRRPNRTHINRSQLERFLESHNVDSDIDDTGLHSFRFRRICGDKAIRNPSSYKPRKVRLGIPSFSVIDLQRQTQTVSKGETM